MAYSSSTVSDEEEEETLKNDGIDGRFVKNSPPTADATYSNAYGDSLCGDGASFGAIFAGAFLTMSLIVGIMIAFLYYVIIPPMQERANILLQNLQNSIDEADRNEQLMLALYERLRTISQTLNDASGLNAVRLDALGAN